MMGGVTFPLSSKSWLEMIGEGVIVAGDDIISGDDQAAMICQVRYVFISVCDCLYECATVSILRVCLYVGTCVYVYVKVPCLRSIVCLRHEILNL